MESHALRPPERSRAVAEQLEKLYGADQGYREPQSRESALFALKSTVEGRMVQDSLVISSEAWFLGRALKGKDWRELLRDFASHLHNGIHFFRPDACPCLVVRGQNVLTFRNRIFLLKIVLDHFLRH
jgi:hypothetical protein